MASVRQHRGRLLIDYREGGTRQRVYTKLADSPANRVQLEQVAAQVELALTKGNSVETILVQAGLLAGPEPVFIAPPQHLRPTTAAATTATPAFSAFAEQWFGEFKVGWRKTYITTVRGILDQHLLPRFGQLMVGAVTRALILDFRAHLAAVRGRRPGTKLSPARINTIMLILRQVLQEAADRYEFTLPMARLKPLKVPKSDVQPFTLEQTHLLINTIRKDYQNYLKVRFFTGMRSGELHGLKWKYVDFEKRLILVREAFVGGEDEYTKTDSSQRDIPLSRVVWEALSAQHKVTGHQEYVFCNRAGEPIDTNNFTKRIWYPLLRHLGLALRRPYQTRHTAATLWLEAGESPAWVAMALGHSSQAMLWKTYARYCANLTRRDGSAMDRLLNATFGVQADAGATPPPAQPPPGNAENAAAA
ncbi:tyrosine-type recombinase/integrase [Rhizobacter sp. AJA081-3]|uniref:tyrosine-type recombinase/integrase n=1 Tax=Rhizobacter sp. AJA081-3 TaxID=2753607 RepID=UPI001ADF8F96|nr:tyrosine-type recombinase/integrase [Rhizobacter sp. AJA081-3]QTN25686.1 tyrosine-type recombinase/integrase [Rhizobacter sp. AJA081-3]